MRTIKRHKNVVPLWQILVAGAMGRHKEVESFGAFLTSVKLEEHRVQLTRAFLDNLVAPREPINAQLEKRLEQRLDRFIKEVKPVAVAAV